MDCYKVCNVVLNGQSVVVGNSETDEIISNVLEVTPEEALYFVAEITAASVSGTGAVAELQHSIDGTNFIDVGSPSQVTVNANGRFLIVLNNAVSTDAAVLPLFRYIRFILTTGGSDAATITKIDVLRR